MTIWSTPQHIFDAVDAEFHFSIDLCADYANAKCKRFLPREISLAHPWDDWEGWGWLNPPYGKKEIDPWVAKAAECKMPIVAMIPGRTNAPWWHDSVMQAMEIRFVKRKVSFFTPGRTKKGVPPWGAVLAVFANHEKSGPLICTSWDWKEPRFDLAQELLYSMRLQVR